MHRVHGLLCLAVLAAGCATHDDTTPAAPKESLHDGAGSDFIKPAAAECHAMEPSKDYPINFCVVSKEDLMTDGQPVAISYNGVEVQFCCDHCVAKFKADPAKYLAVLEEAKAAKAGK